jgi:hypothetical protein
MKVFISHSSSDNRFVRTLKEDLNENGIQTWFDEDELDLGDALADKLELALEDSSHFIIVLSKASVNSDWVKFELEKALKQKNSALLQKIIPVKYGDCEVPTSLDKLIYADLSKEIRIVRGDKVDFASSIYSDFLSKLCRAIRNSEKQLSPIDKTSLKKEIIEKVPIQHTTDANRIIKASYKLIGYKDADTRLSYAKTVTKNTKNKNLADPNLVRPILLPPLLKSAFKHLEIGDEVYFSKNYFFNEIGHFAGFRKDDLCITLDQRIRKGLSVMRGTKYNVEIDIEQRRINFILNN